MPDIKVLIVDDSAVLRQFLKDRLNAVSGINVVGTAPDAFVARSKILRYEPDVITLDVQMPKMDGLTFLRKMMEHKPMPVIIFSSLTRKGADLALDALEAGAVDYVKKPESSDEIEKVIHILVEKINQAAKANLDNRSMFEETKNVGEIRGIDSQKIIAIGASTGGTVAIKEILTKLPPNFPPIIIVQHMPAYFTKAFADRLNTLCEINVKEAEEGDHLYPGTALIAPGNYHMELENNKSGYIVSLNQNDLTNNQRPSVEVLFNSVAEVAGKNSIGVILTGMGSDGAKGLLNMKKAGAYTIAQDENSSVVFGMPKQAIRVGAADKIAKLTDIPNILLNQLSV